MNKEQAFFCVKRPQQINIHCYLGYASLFYSWLLLLATENNMSLKPTRQREQCLHFVKAQVKLVGALDVYFRSWICQLMSGSLLNNTAVFLGGAAFSCNNDDVSRNDLLDSIKAILNRLCYCCWKLSLFCKTWMK